MPLKAKGEFALVKRNLEHALPTAGQPVNFGTMAHDHEVYMMLADAAAETRDAEALQKYPAGLAELAKRDGHALYLAIAQRALGVAHRLAGRHREASTLLVDSLAAFRQLGARWQAGRTLLELAELEANRPKKGSKSREYYAEALGFFEEMRAAPYAERARAALTALA